MIKNAYVDLLKLQYISVCIILTLTSVLVLINGVNHDITAPKRNKMFDVDDHVKQRVVIQFLSEEKSSMDEIQNRLKSIYGEDVVDVNQVASPDERQAWTLDRRLKERIIIQFLTAEKVCATEIFERLKNVYGDCIPPSTVQRWAKQFRDGRTSVGNKQRPKA